jgi:hypothetical protein
MKNVIYSRLEANDNNRPWKLGFVDGVTESWSDHLANLWGRVAKEYLAGWMAGADLAEVGQPSPN